MADLTEQQLLSQDPEILGLQRQRALANLLTGQAFNAPQGQVISGRYVKPSGLQQALPMINAAIGTASNANLDTKSQEMAQRLREEGITEAQAITEAQKKGNTAAYIQALRGRTPVSQGMATVLQKQLLEGPEWKEAKLPQADGSELHGWVNVKSQNPLATFVQGATKPAYTPMEGAKYQYETGMQPPSYQTGQPNRFVQPNTPIMQNAPMQGTPVQGSPVQPSLPMSNRVGTQAMPMSNQVGNQPISATGNTVPVSAMNRPGMSPKDLSEANKQIYAKTEEQRQADLRSLPGALEQAKSAISTVNDMIGDARLDDKGEIVYQKYDPVSKKWVEGKQPHAGFENFVGATYFPKSYFPGTDSASFEPLYKAIKGEAFLQAFERLKGGGQITEVEGQKATEALLKLDKAQNEKDFIKYAREFQENLQRGMELAKNKAGVSKEYRSPVGQPALRWNPQTNSWVNQ
jgi:hypothetical protein